MTVDSAPPLVAMQQQAPDPFEAGAVGVHRRQITIAKSGENPANQRKHASNIEPLSSNDVGVAAISGNRHGGSKSPRRRKKSAPVSDILQGEGNKSLSHLDLEDGQSILSPRREGKHHRLHKSTGHIEMEEQDPKLRRRRRRSRSRKKDDEDTRQEKPKERIKKSSTQQPAQSPQQQKQSSDKRRSTTRSSTSDKRRSSTRNEDEPGSGSLSTSLREERSMLRRERRALASGNIPAPVISTSVVSQKQKSGNKSRSASPRRALRKSRASTTGISSSTSRSLSPSKVRRQLASTTDMEESLLSPRAQRRKLRSLAIAIQQQGATPLDTGGLSPERRRLHSSMSALPPLESENVTPTPERRRHRASTSSISSQIKPPELTSMSPVGSLSPISERRRKRAQPTKPLEADCLSPSERRRQRSSMPASTKSPSPGASRSKSPYKRRSSKPAIIGRSQTTPSPSTSGNQSLQGAPQLEPPLTSPASTKEKVSPTGYSKEHVSSSPRKDRRRRHRTSAQKIKDSNSSNDSGSVENLSAQIETSSQSPSAKVNPGVGRHSMPAMQPLVSPISKKGRASQRLSLQSDPGNNSWHGGKRVTKMEPKLPIGKLAGSGHKSLRTFLDTDALSATAGNSEDQSISLQSEPALSPRRHSYRRTRHRTKSTSPVTIRKSQLGISKLKSTVTTPQSLENMLELDGSWDKQASGRIGHTFPPKMGSESSSIRTSDVGANYATKIKPNSAEATANESEESRKGDSTNPRTRSGFREISALDEETHPKRTPHALKQEIEPLKLKLNSSVDQERNTDENRSEINTSQPQKESPEVDVDWTFNNSWHGGPWGFQSEATNRDISPSGSSKLKDLSAPPSPAATLEDFLQPDPAWQKSSTWREGRLGSSWQSEPTPTALSSKKLSENVDNNRSSGPTTDPMVHDLHASSAWTAKFTWTDEPGLLSNDEALSIKALDDKTPANDQRHDPPKPPSSFAVEAVLESFEDSIVWSHSFVVPEEVVSPESPCSHGTSRWHNSSNFADDPELPSSSKAESPVSPMSPTWHNPNQTKSGCRTLSTSLPPPPIESIPKAQASPNKMSENLLGAFFDESRWEPGGLRRDEDRSIAHLSLKSEPLPNPKRTSSPMFDNTPSVAATEPPPSTFRGVADTSKQQKEKAGAGRNSLGAFLDSRWHSGKGGDEPSVGHRSLKSEPPISPMRRSSFVGKNVISQKSPSPRASDGDSQRPPRSTSSKNKKLGAFLDDARWNHGGRSGEEDASVGHRSLKSEPPMSPLRTSSFGTDVRIGPLKLPLSSPADRDKAPNGKPPRNGKKSRKSLKAFFDDSRWKSSTNIVDDEKSHGHISLQSEPPYTPTRRSSFNNNDASQSVSAYLPSPTVAGSEDRAKSVKPRKKKKGSSLEAFFDDSRWKSSNVGPEEEADGVSLHSEPPLNPLRKNSIVQKVRSTSVATPKGAAPPSQLPLGNSTWDEDVKLLLQKCENLAFFNGNALET